MERETDTVRGRIDLAAGTLTGTQLALAVGFVAALGFTLLFLQEPLAHDALHNFRHSAGVTCH
ncbi:CbtB domain-containing protein [Halomicrobium salinisoli]|uniref:CbtB domain-containing protein n=1 Tax=Halomicrobium salinisoli TaxID=2878391 RepID=UPI001CEFF0C7|nr:CbtB domain-containing protein [Halomicrobium salinisoli]